MARIAKKPAAEPVAVSTPDLGKRIDQLYKLQQKRLAAQRKVDEIKRQETALDAEIRTTLLDARLTAAKGKSASFSVSTEIVAQVDDWSAFHEWIAEHGAFDLLQHRVANGAYRDVLASGATPAGTRAEKILKSSIRKAGGR